MSAFAARPFIAAFATVLVIAAVAGGLWILGSPAQERVDRLDDRRIADLQRIEQAVNLHWTRQQRLPASLDELSREPGVRISLHDPLTMEPYAYQPLGENRFEVCAVFEGGEGAGSATRDPAYGPRERSIVTFWSHGAGRQCFQPATRNLRPSY